MNGEERLEKFLTTVNNWINGHDIVEFKKNEDIDNLVNMSQEELSSLSASECIENAYSLYAYSEYLLSLQEEQKTVFDWADSSIWFIVSGLMNQYGDNYTKWEQKYYSAVRENPLAREILGIKQNAKARISSIGSKADTIKKMADMLNSLSRSRR